MKNTVRQKRIEKGLSQSRLAALVGVTQGNLSYVETGRFYAWPKLRRNLARSLGATEQQLFPPEEALDGQPSEENRDVAAKRASSPLGGVN